MKGLSVVIPCYNSRDSIIKCLKSIENNIVDVEVIVIEDCSESSSEELVKNYASHSNLSIRYEKNEVNLGAGETRNRGISLATRDYITFLDSDDELSDDYFATIKNVLKLQYDMIVYDAIKVSRNSQMYLSMFFSNRMQEGKISKREALVYIKGSTWGKIYRTSIIKNNDVAFARLNRNEDMVFTKIATSYMESVFYIKKGLYQYNDNENSLMHDISLLTEKNAISAYGIVKEKLMNRGFEKELNSILLIEVLYSTTNTLLKLERKTKEIKDNYRKYRRNYNWNDPYRKLYSKQYQIAICFFELGAFRLYWITRSLIKKRH